MQENIRKFVESAEHPILAVPLFLRQGWETTKASPSFSLPLAGCPILAVPLFLRQGWETTEASPVLVFAFGPSAALRPRRSAPRQNVAKSVAKARKTHQVTTPQPQTYQSHSSHFPRKTPHPPLFRPKAVLNRTLDLLSRCLSAKDEIGIWRLPALQGAENGFNRRGITQQKEQFLWAAIAG